MAKGPTRSAGRSTSTRQTAIPTTRSRTNTGRNATAAAEKPTRSRSATATTTNKRNTGTSQQQAAAGRKGGQTTASKRSTTGATATRKTNTGTNQRTAGTSQRGQMAGATSRRSSKTNQQQEMIQLSPEEIRTQLLRNALEDVPGTAQARGAMLRKVNRAFEPLVKQVEMLQKELNQYRQHATAGGGQQIAGGGQQTMATADTAFGTTQGPGAMAGTPEQGGNPAFTGGWGTPDQPGTHIQEGLTEGAYASGGQEGAYASGGQEVAGATQQRSRRQT
jgi:hypothetical protein